MKNIRKINGIEEKITFMIGVADRFQRGSMDEKKNIFLEIGSRFQIKNSELLIEENSISHKLRVLDQGFEIPYDFIQWYLSTKEKKIDGHIWISV